MGREESWILVNIDRKESSGYLDGLDYGFFKHRDSPRQAKKWLTLPVMTRKVATWLASRLPVVQTGVFSKLSVELIDLIFEHLATSTSIIKLHDMISFAITCTTILVVGERHLLRVLRTHHAHWGDGRLICLNDWTQWGDLPPGLLTDAETHELETTMRDGYDSGEDHRTLYEYARELYKDGLLCPDDRRNADSQVASYLEWRLDNAEYPTLDHIVKRDRVRVSGVPWDDTKRFLAIYHGECPTARKGSVGVLCNLSKAEYIRGDMLPKGVGLDSALLSRICWCSRAKDFDFRCEGEYRQRLMRGPWAGDRFCIVTLDMLPEVFDGKEGKDVSEEARELLQHIWTLKRAAEREQEQPVQQRSSTKSQGSEKESSDSDDTSSDSSNTSTDDDTSTDDSDTSSEGETSSEEESSDSSDRTDQ